MKQIQFAVVPLNIGNAPNPVIREQLESMFENGWVLDSWQPVGVFPNEESNKQEVRVIVCLTREKDVEAVKRGRPKKEDA